MDEDRVTILDQNHWQPATPALKGGYMVIDLNKPDLVTYSFNKRFRQGENGVKIPLWFYDGSIPHQLDPSKSAVTAYGKDSNGKIKVVEAQPEADWQSGRVDMYLPLAVFQAAGQYQRFLIEVKNNDQIIATINFNLDVLPNDFYNITVGSQNFSSQINDEIITRLTEFRDKALNIAKSADAAILEFKGDYDLLKAQVDDISKTIDANQIVKLADYNKEVKILDTTRYTAKDIAWKAPFSSWSEAGGSSLAVSNGVVHMSLSAISSSFGSVICTLPADCRPKSEKVGVGISLDGDGHDAQPLFISIMPNGDVVAENNGHDIAKIALVTSFNLDESEEDDGTGTDTGSSDTDPIVSIVQGVQMVNSGDSISTNKDVTVYLSDGSISRTLPAGSTWQVDRKGTMKSNKVVRISNDEWVNLMDEGVYYVSAASGTVTMATNSPTLVDRYGNPVTYTFKSGDPYQYDSTMNYHDGQAIYYRISPDQWVSKTSVTMGGTGTTKPVEPDPAPDISVTNIGVTTANDNAGIYKSTTLYRGNGAVSRTVSAGNNLNIDRFGTMNGAKVFRVSSDEWVKESDIAHTLDGAQGVLKIKNNPQSVYHISGIPYSTTLGVGEPYVYKRRMYKAGGVTAYELSPDQYIDSTQCTI